MGVFVTLRIWNDRGAWSMRNAAVPCACNSQVLPPSVGASDVMPSMPMPRTSLRVHDEGRVNCSPVPVRSESSRIPGLPPRLTVTETVAFPPVVMGMLTSLFPGIVGLKPFMLRSATAISVPSTRKAGPREGKRDFLDRGVMERV